MQDILTYAASSIILSGGFYALFRAFLQGEKAFALNRWILLGLVALGLALPALSFTDLFKVEEEALPAPRKSVTMIVGQGLRRAVSFERAAEPVVVVPRENVGIAPRGDEAKSATKTSASADKEFPYAALALTIYLIGLLALLSRFLIGLKKIANLRKRGANRLYGNFSICEVDEPIAPFSFWKTIYIPSGIYADSELRQIILHERAHVSQRHSVDLILLEFACALGWFNPFLRLFKKSAIELHEYLADLATLSAGISRFDYSSTLYKNLTGEKLFASSHYLNKDQIKRRLKMMSKVANRKFSALKYALVIPAVAIISLVFSCSQEAGRSDSDFKDMRVSLKYQKLHSNDANGFVVEFPNGEKGLKDFLMKCEDLRKLYERKNKFVQLVSHFKIDKKGNPVKQTISVGVGDYGVGIKTAQLSDRVRKYLENMPSLKVVKINNPAADYANMELAINFGDFENNAYQFAFSEPVHDVEAEFPGGQAEKENFIKKNLRTPQEAQSHGLHAKFTFISSSSRTAA